MVLGTDPAYIKCSHCRMEGETNTHTSPGKFACLCCCLLCLIGCYLCCCLPCYLKVFRETIHTCKHCNFVVRVAQQEIMRELEGDLQVVQPLSQESKADISQSPNII